MLKHPHDNSQTEPLNRCAWAGSDPLYIKYHDQEWGVPIHDDRLLFEFLMLEGMQAGLSWFTILKKREAFRANFDNFNLEKIITYDDAKIAELMSNPAIIRNLSKIKAIINNAKCVMTIKHTHGSLSNFLWEFVDNKPIINHWKKQTDVPATSPQSDLLSKALKGFGLKYVGSTICYAFMQAVGMVDDHICSCYIRATNSA